MEELKKLSASLTPEELKYYEEKAEELARKYSVSKVHPVVQIDEENGYRRIVCYLKEPNYDTKLRVMDKMATVGIFSASNELREACTLREESDAISYGESHECDSSKMGVTEYCVTIVKRLNNQFKKKSQNGM